MTVSRPIRRALKRCKNDMQRQFQSCGFAVHVHRGIPVLVFWEKKFQRSIARDLRNMGPGAHYFTTTAHGRRRLANDAIEAAAKKLGHLAPVLLPKSTKRRRPARKRRA